jgi:hypothetical protein
VVVVRAAKITVNHFLCALPCISQILLDRWEVLLLGEGISSYWLLVKERALSNSVVFPGLDFPKVLGPDGDPRGPCLAPEW